MRRIAYHRLPTERANPRSRNLDQLSPLAIVSLMNREDRQVLAAVHTVRRQVAAAVELIVASLRSGGRLFFVGAGTSGRLGVIEAAECAPTFGTPPSVVQAIVAGGRSAVFRSREGAEDRQAEARQAIRRRVRRGDVVVGISASGVTPFVRAALAQARQRKARTVLLAMTPLSPVGRLADVVIAPRTGPEILAGSTRLKAGSATKMVLDMLTTGPMVRLGKVYGNRMVDLRASSLKLRARGERLVQELGGVSRTRARRLLQAADGR
ncbi:MAG: N-acetylmuramic acid 6-phosphate etherase, partial [Candidatus Rokubacteria bacterium]|nr:N-acetylmuramic acid 6-phosphate etherase [Candidatus Rokubacteria bacterium]